MSIRPTILIVEDEKDTADGLKKLLEPSYDVVLSQSAEAAIPLVKSDSPDIILSDLRLTGMDGLELLREIKKIKKDPVVIILTAYGTVENAVKAMRLGAFHYLTKPLNSEELTHVLEKAIEAKRLVEDNVELRRELERQRGGENIIGESAVIKTLLETASQVARSNASVLIEGESGTGKELLAHYIHAMSPRKDKPFVVVHCASLTETLLASELFGHERGAFTGAIERKIGRFERANEGTVFLDEVSEIREDMQVKLLRILQEGEFERVGGTKTIKADVRIISATNKVLQEEVKKGNFREDLFYRLNVITLEVPPLRERKEDIPLLVNYYKDFFAETNRKEIRSVEVSAMEALKNYGWPGNIRELKNVIERIVVLSQGDIIRIGEIPSDIRGGGVGGEREGTELKATNLREAEKELIQKKLIECKGNKSKAAETLGISRRTLYRKIEEYGLK
ncbi:MAG: sigma-54 dependent transcriptional regulator [Candidatus Omnitrophica bacterium]|nr:sigma-54 dependent transcriptional regulator [Candidatus Omnitrophota bacterium]